MAANKNFNVIVLEDNVFYNNLLTRHLTNYLEDLMGGKFCRFEIRSYTSPIDCLRNLKPDTDVVFVDFYLGDNRNALEVIEKIKLKCRQCTVIVMSQVANAKTSFQTMKSGASDFILKDRFALLRSCLLVEGIVSERLHPRLY